MGVFLNFTTFVIFCAAILVAVTTYMLHSKNKLERLIRIDLPFTKFIPPLKAEDSTTVSLIKSDGTPQISCPIGTKVNILGAFFEVYDPYGQCTDTPSKIVLETCNPAIGASCSADADCPLGTICTGSRCAKATDSDQCTRAFIGSTANPRSKYPQCDPGDAARDSKPCYKFIRVDSKPPICTLSPICNSLTANGMNEKCNKNCRPRDASAYLASKCNGTQSCLGAADSFDILQPFNSNDKSGNPFGPFPCNIRPNESAYYDLPIIVGNNDNTSDAPQGKVGYYIHGTYSCVPDTEAPK